MALRKPPLTKRMSSSTVTSSSEQTDELECIDYYEVSNEELLNNSLNSRSGESNEFLPENQSRFTALSNSEPSTLKENSDSIHYDSFQDFNSSDQNRIDDFPHPTFEISKECRSYLSAISTGNHAGTSSTTSVSTLLTKEQVQHTDRIRNERRKQKRMQQNKKTKCKKRRENNDLHLPPTETRRSLLPTPSSFNSSIKDRILPKQLRYSDNSQSSDRVPIPLSRVNISAFKEALRCPTSHNVSYESELATSHPSSEKTNSTTQQPSVMPPLRGILKKHISMSTNEGKKKSTKKVHFEDIADDSPDDIFNRILESDYSYECRAHSDTEYEYGDYTNWPRTSPSNNSLADSFGIIIKSEPNVEELNTITNMHGKVLARVTNFGKILPKKIFIKPEPEDNREEAVVENAQISNNDLSTADIGEGLRNVVEENIVKQPVDSTEQLVTDTTLTNTVHVCDSQTTTTVNEKMLTENEEQSHNMDANVATENVKVAKKNNNEDDEIIFIKEFPKTGKNIMKKKKMRDVEDTNVALKAPKLEASEKSNGVVSVDTFSENSSVKVLPVEIGPEDGELSESGSENCVEILDSTEHGETQIAGCAAIPRCDSVCSVSSSSSSFSVTGVPIHNVGVSPPMNYMEKFYATLATTAASATTISTTTVLTTTQADVNVASIVPSVCTEKPSVVTTATSKQQTSSSSGPQDQAIWNSTMKRKRRSRSRTYSTSPEPSSSYDLPLNYQCADAARSLRSDDADKNRVSSSRHKHSRIMWQAENENSSEAHRHSRYISSSSDENSTRTNTVKKKIKYSTGDHHSNCATTSKKIIRITTEELRQKNTLLSLCKETARENDQAQPRRNKKKVIREEEERLNAILAKNKNEQTPPIPPELIKRLAKIMAEEKLKETANIGLSKADSSQVRESVAMNTGKNKKSKNSVKRPRSRNISQVSSASSVRSLQEAEASEQIGRNAKEVSGKDGSKSVKKAVSRNNSLDPAGTLNSNTMFSRKGVETILAKAVGNPTTSTNFSSAADNNYITNENDIQTQADNYMLHLKSQFFELSALPNSSVKDHTILQTNYERANLAKCPTEMRTKENSTIDIPYNDSSLNDTQESDANAAANVEMEDIDYRTFVQTEVQKLYKNVEFEFQPYLSVEIFKDEESFERTKTFKSRCSEVVFRRVPAASSGNKIPNEVSLQNSASACIERDESFLSAESMDVVPPDSGSDDSYDAGLLCIDDEEAIECVQYNEDHRPPPQSNCKYQLFLVDVEETKNLVNQHSTSMDPKKTDFNGNSGQRIVEKSSQSFEQPTDPRLQKRLHQKSSATGAGTSTSTTAPVLVSSANSWTRNSINYAKKSKCAADIPIHQQHKSPLESCVKVSSAPRDQSYYNEQMNSKNAHIDTFSADCRQNSPAKSKGGLSRSAIAGNSTPSALSHKTVASPVSPLTVPVTQEAPQRQVDELNELNRTRFDHIEVPSNSANDDRLEKKAGHKTNEEVRAKYVYYKAKFGRVAEENLELKRINTEQHNNNTIIAKAVENSQKENKLLLDENHTLKMKYEEEIRKLENATFQLNKKTFEWDRERKLMEAKVEMLMAEAKTAESEAQKWRLIAETGTSQQKVDEIWHTRTVDAERKLDELKMKYNLSIESQDKLKEDLDHTKNLLKNAKQELHDHKDVSANLTHSVNELKTELNCVTAAKTVAEKSVSELKAQLAFTADAEKSAALSERAEKAESELAKLRRQPGLVELRKAIGEFEDFKKKVYERVEREHKLEVSRLDGRVKLLEQEKAEALQTLEDKSSELAVVKEELLATADRLDAEVKSHKFTQGLNAEYESRLQKEFSLKFNNEPSSKSNFTPPPPADPSTESSSNDVCFIETSKNAILNRKRPATPTTLPDSSNGDINLYSEATNIDSDINTICPDDTLSESALSKTKRNRIERSKDSPNNPLDTATVIDQLAETTSVVMLSDDNAHSSSDDDDIQFISMTLNSKTTDETSSNLLQQQKSPSASATRQQPRKQNLQTHQKLVHDNASEQKPETSREIAKNANDVTNSSATTASVVNASSSRAYGQLSSSPISTSPSVLTPNTPADAAAYKRQSSFQQQANPAFVQQSYEAVDAAVGDASAQQTRLKQNLQHPANASIFGTYAGDSSAGNAFSSQQQEQTSPNFLAGDNIVNSESTNYIQQHVNSTQAALSHIMEKNMLNVNTSTNVNLMNPTIQPQLFAAPQQQQPNNLIGSDEVMRIQLQRQGQQHQQLQKQQGQMPAQQQPFQQTGHNVAQNMTFDSSLINIDLTGAEMLESGVAASGLNQSSFLPPCQLQEQPYNSNHLSHSTQTTASLPKNNQSQRKATKKLTAKQQAQETRKKQKQQRQQAYLESEQRDMNATATAQLKKHQHQSQQTNSQPYFQRQPPSYQLHQQQPTFSFQQQQQPSYQQQQMPSSYQQQQQPQNRLNFMPRMQQPYWPSATPNLLQQQISQQQMQQNLLQQKQQAQMQQRQQQQQQQSSQQFIRTMGLMTGQSAATTSVAAAMIQHKSNTIAATTQQPIIGTANYGYVPNLTMPNNQGALPTANTSVRTTIGEEIANDCYKEFYHEKFMKFLKRNVTLNQVFSFSPQEKNKVIANFSSQNPLSVGMEAGLYENLWNALEFYLQGQGERLQNHQ